MHRVLISSRAVSGHQITVDDPRDVHHLVRVLRVRVGEPIECFDGRGRAYRGRLAHADSRRLVIAVEQQRDEPPPRVKLHLVQSLIPPVPFEWVLQKATELGAARITPVITSRTTVRRPAGVGRSRMDRWQRIVIEATAQSGRATLPMVDEPARFEDVVKTFGARHVLLPTLVDPRVPLADSLNRLNGSHEIVILIGPEGDFSPEEVSLAARAGAQPVSLGTATLRSETAAVATLAILNHLIERTAGPQCG